MKRPAISPLLRALSDRGRHGMRPRRRVRTRRPVLEDLEARLTLSAGDMTTLIFNIPPDVAAQGVSLGMYGNSANQGGEVYYATVNTAGTGFDTYAPASSLMKNTPNDTVPVPLLQVVKPSTSYSSPQQVQVALPVPESPLQGLWGGELFMFVGSDDGLSAVSDSSGNAVIAAPKAMPDPAIPDTLYDFAQFEFTYTNAGGTSSDPATLDVDSSAVDSTGFPFALVYPQSSASFPLNPLGITQTQGGIVVNFNADFSPGGTYAAYPQFQQDGQVNSQQVVAPQDILAEETGAPPDLITGQASYDAAVVGLAGSAIQGEMTLTLDAPLTSPVESGWTVVGANLPGNVTVKDEAKIGDKTISITGGSVSKKGPDVYTFLPTNNAPLNNPLAGVSGSGSGSSLTLNSANVPVLAGMGVTGTFLKPGTFITWVTVGESTTTVGISQPVDADAADSYTFTSNLAPAINYYLITAFSDNQIPHSNGLVGETLPSNEVNATVLAGQTVTIAWNKYEDPNTAGYDVYRYIATDGAGPTASSEYTLIAHLYGSDTTRFTDLGSVSQAQQDATSDVAPAVSPITASNYGFNPLSDYFTQDILDFFDHYRTNTFSMNRVGVLWTGNTVSYTPTADWNTTALSGVSSFVPGATSLAVADSNGVIAGETISGPGIAPGTTIVSVTGTTIQLSQGTASGEAAGTSLTVRATYTVLQLTAQNSYGGVTAGEVLNIYQPIFASNTRFVTADEETGAPAPPMPSWLAANFNPYESPSQMVFACDAVFASNKSDPDVSNADLATALGALEDSISSAFNRGIATTYTIPPDNWASFPQILTAPVVTPTPQSTLAKGTYYYEVTAVNAFGETTPSLEIAADVTEDDTQEVTFSWSNGSSAPAATKYNIYRGSSPGGPLTFLTSTSKTMFPDDQSHYDTQTNQTPSNEYFRLGTQSNWYAAYVQSNSVIDPVDGVSINGLSYGFPYSDQGGVSTNQYFAGDIPSDITVNLGELDNLGFLTQDLPYAVTGQSYTQTIVASGSMAGDATFTSTDLPGWLTLTSEGVLSSTSVVPSDFRTATFIITATSGSSTTSLNFTLIVAPPTSIPPLAVAGLNNGLITLPAGEANAYYSATIQVSGGTGPYQVSQLSNPPENLVSNPLNPGGVTVTGKLGNVSSSTPHGFILLVGDSRDIESPATLVNGDFMVQDGSQLTKGMEVSGPGLDTAKGPVIINTIEEKQESGVTTWEVTLEYANINSPANPQAGMFTFNDAISFTCNILVNPKLAITTTPQLPTANEDDPFAVQLTTNATDEAVVFTATTPLPDWLHLSPSGSLSGTAPSTAQPEASFTIEARSPYSQVSQTFALSVGDVPPPTLSPATLPAATSGEEYPTTTLNATGEGPLTFVLVNGDLPPGLNLVGNSIQGTPASGVDNLAYFFTVRVTDGLGRVAFQGYEIDEGNPPSNPAPQITGASQLAENATTLVLTGTNFDPIASQDGVRFLGGPAGVSGTVTSATTTQLIVSLSGKITKGDLGFVEVTVNQQDSNQMFLGIAIAGNGTPTIAADTSSVALNGVFTISGTGFDTTVSNNIILLDSSGITGTATGASSTQLTVSLSGLTVDDIGDILTARVIVDGLPSNDASIGTIGAIRQPPTINSYVNQPYQNSTAITITGTGFDTDDPLNNRVMLSYTDDHGNVKSINIQSVSVNSPTQLTVVLAEPLPTLPAGTPISATVMVDGVVSNSVQINPFGPSGTPAINAAPDSVIAPNATTLVITGSNFMPLAISGTSTNGELSLSVASTAGLVTGMLVYGPGIQPDTKVLDIDTKSSSLTLSTDASSAASDPAGSGTFVFASSPATFIPVTGGSTVGEATVSGLSSTGDLFRGMVVTGPGIQAGTTILSVDGASQVTLSTDAVAGAGAGTFTFVAYPVILTASNKSGALTYQSHSIDSPGQIMLTGLSGLTAGTAVQATVGQSGGATAIAKVTTAVPPAAPTIEESSSVQTSPQTLIITGNDFDTTSDGTNLVILYVDSTELPLGFVDKVVANSATQLIVTLTGPLPAGAIEATVVTDGVTSGTPVEVARVMAFSVTPDTATKLTNGPTILTIQGYGFDPEGTNTVALFADGAGTTAISADAISSVVAVSSTELMVILNTAYPMPTGALYASVTTNGQLLAATGTPDEYVYQVADLVDNGPKINLAATNLASNASTLIISGTDFSTTAAHDVVTLYSTGGELDDAVDQVTVEGSTLIVSLEAGVSLPIGQLYATLSTPTSLSDEVQVGNVVSRATTPTVTPDPSYTLDPEAASLEIDGSGFDMSPGAINLVTLFGPSKQPLTSGTVAAIDDGTKLIVALDPSDPLPAGNLYATVTVDGVVAGTMVVVGAVVGQPVPTITPPVPIPTIKPNTTALTIDGTHFDPGGQNEVTLYSDGRPLFGLVQSASARSSTELVVTLAGTLPGGTLSASVTVDGVAMSGQPVTIASVAATPTISPGTVDFVSGVDTILDIVGTGFDADDQVSFTHGAVGSVVNATPTQLTVRVTFPPTGGILAASVRSPSSGLASPMTQVALVHPNLSASTTNLPAGTTTLTILGAGFSGVVADNTVQLSSGAVGMVLSVSSARNSLKVALSKPPTQAGPLYAVVFVNDYPSAGVQVATVSPGLPSAAESILAVSANTVVAGQTVTLTLRARDTYGNPLTVGGDTVAFGSSSGGTLGDVKDNHDGTYTATFESSLMGPTTFTATLNGAGVTSTAVATVCVESDFPGEGDLSAPWMVRAGTFGAGNNAVTGGTGKNLAIYGDGVAEDVAASISVSHLRPGGAAMLVARYTSRSDYYRAGIVNDRGKFFAVIQDVRNGKVTSLIKTSANFTGSSVVTFEASGQSLRLSLDGTQVAAASVSKSRRGKVGFFSKGQAKLSSFLASPIGPSTTP